MNINLPTRRRFVAATGFASVLPFLSACGGTVVRAQDGQVFPITKTEAEWREVLSRDEYFILRDAGTERAWTSPLNEEKREGTFVCAGCENELYSSAHKYESYSGWPSFWQPIGTGAVGTSTDYKIGYPRTEVHCADCGGHLGHIFGDGPAPTGERHCINGLAMNFIAA